MKSSLFIFLLVLNISGYSQTPSGLSHYFPLNGSLIDNITGFKGRLKGYDTTYSRFATDRENNLSCAVSSGSYTNWASLPFVKLLNSDSAFTISMWMIIPRGSKGGIIGSENQYEVDTYNSLLFYHHEMGMSWNYSPNFKITTDKWIHIAVTYNKGASNLYVNDTLKNSSYRRIASSPTPLGITILKTMDDLSIYSRELNRKELTDLFNTPSTCSPITGMNSDLEIQGFSENKEVVQSYSIYGQKLEKGYISNGPVIHIYSDGSRKKEYGYTAIK